MRNTTLTELYVGERPSAVQVLPMSGQVVTGGGGVAATLDASGMSIDLTGRMLRLTLTVSDVTKIGNLSLFVATSGSLANNIRWRFNAQTASSQVGKSGEPFQIALQLAEINTVAGTITLSSTGVPSQTSGFTAVRLHVVDKATGPITVTLHRIEVVPAPPGAFVSITFDDSHSSITSQAFPKMQALGFRGTDYTIAGALGQADRSTLADVQARAAAGWEIGGHAYAESVHDARLTGVTAAQALADLTALRGWLAQKFPDPQGRYSLAYPGGRYEDTTDGAAVEAITAQAGFTSGRTILADVAVSTHVQVASPRDPMPFRLHAMSGISSLTGGQFNPTTLTATGGMLDKVASNGGWLILAFHRIVTGSPTVQTEISKTDFDAVMDAIAARGMTVLPVREVLETVAESGWVDVTADARQGVADSGGGHTITRRDGDAGTMDLVLASAGGKYSPRNPRSEYFGLLGRNTPVRFGLELAAFDFATPVTEGWGTGWVSFGAGGTILSTDSHVTAGTARHSVPVAGGYRVSYYDALPLVDCEIRTTVHMQVVNVLGGALEPANLLFRLQDINTYYMARVEITAGEQVLVSLHHSTGGVIAGPVTVAGLTYTGLPLEVAASCVGDRLAVKVWDPTAGGEPREWQVTAVDDQLRAAGPPGVRSGVAGGNTNTKPIQFWYDNLRVIDRRAVMEVSEWPPRWSTTGSDVWVPLQASGILRRLGQGAKPLDSALYRYLTVGRPGLAYPTVYWPLEDPAGSLSARAVTAGVEPMIPFGYSRFTAPGSGAPVEAAALPEFGSGTGIPGSGPVVDLSRGGVLQGRVPAAATPGGGWRVEWVMRAPRDKADTVVPIRFESDGSYRVWDVQIEPTGVFATVYVDDPLAGAVASASASFNVFDGLPHHYAVEVYPDGSNVGADLRIDDVLVDSYSPFTPPLVGSPGNLSRVIVNPLEVRQDEPQSSAMPTVGHIAGWNPLPVDFPDTHEAMTGHLGETTAARIERLCDEQGVPVFVSEGPDESAAMGPQGIATFLDLLRECADADGGILGEAREQIALTYRCLGALYNQTPLELDYTHLAPPLEPVDDDDLVRNDVEAKSPSGGAARAVLETGPLSVQAPPDGVGTYDTSVTVNVASDVQLPDQAGWRLHVGTWDEARYPVMRVNLGAPVWTGDAELTAAASALTAGDVLSVGGLPEWLPPGPAVVMVRESVERIDQHTRTVDWTLTPAGPYTVGTVGGDPRVAADGSTLAAALTAADDPSPINVNPYLTTDLSGWVAANATILRSTSTLPPVNDATASLRITVGNASSGGANADVTAPVNAAVTYWVQMWAWSASALTVGPAVDWYNTGGYLSTSIGPLVTLTPGVWTYIAGGLTPPVGATGARMRARHGSGSTVGAVWHAWAPRLGRRVQLSLASTAANGPWTVDPADFPLDVRVGGERMTLSAITGGASPQTATLSARAVNGVALAWPAGTEVDVAEPAYAAL
ncbi:polysaccharide deacetylase family protein [Micromonospora sp. WMMD558]|uniref:polysaccharide deacetylase family protein n=1 Tax=Micromonospora sp. WMMD558 TaxID=3403462 RepID=UPI003BF61BC9